MNKTKLLFFIIAPLAILFYANTALAEETPSVLYCPEKIECLKEKSVSSCKAVGEHLEYWNKISANGTVRKDVYSLMSAQANYQDPNENYITMCSYSNYNYPNTGLSISINSSIEDSTKYVRWEAAKNDETLWQIYGYLALSNSIIPPLNPSKYPLQQVPIAKLTAASNLNMLGISVYANGILIGNEYWSSCSNGTCLKAVNMYQAWDACSDTGLCTLELMANINQALVDIGSIVIDMDNKMKIVHVHAITGFKISLDEKTNSIEIKQLS